MIFSSDVRNILFKVFALLSGLAALYHLAGLFYKVNESPLWRHCLFIAINIFCVCGFLKRPKYFLIFFVLIFIQQYYSHGTYMIRLWMEQDKLHLISLIELMLLPVALICLIEDVKARSK